MQKTIKIFATKFFEFSFQEHVEPYLRKGYKVEISLDHESPNNLLGAKEDAHRLHNSVSIRVYQD